MGYIVVLYSYALPGRSAIKLVLDNNKHSDYLKLGQKTYNKIMAVDSNYNQTFLSYSIILKYLEHNSYNLGISDPHGFAYGNFVFKHEFNLSNFLIDDNLILPTSNDAIDIFIKGYSSKQIKMSLWDTCLMYFPKPYALPLWRKSKLNDYLMRCDIPSSYLMPTHVIDNTKIFNLLSPDNRDYVCKPDSSSGGKGNFIISAYDVGVRVLQELEEIEYEYEIDFKYDPQRNWNFFIARKNYVMSGGYATLFTLDTKHEDAEVKEAISLTKHIMDGCFYTGIGSLSFLKTPTGLKVLEFNPRLTGTTAAMIYIGENILENATTSSSKVVKIGCNIQDYFIMDQ